MPPIRFPFFASQSSSTLLNIYFYVLYQIGSDRIEYNTLDFTYGISYEIKWDSLLLLLL